MPAGSDSVFVVNPASGGGAGRRLVRELRRRFAPERVLLLQEVDLLQVAERWRGKAAALIACGGDGSATAALEAAQPGEQLPVGIIALGTGNDLARATGFPGAFHDDLDVWLERIAGARPRPIDRWLLHGPGKPRAWYNYCSYGFDARVANRFHTLRQQNKQFFRWRLANLACYAGIGLQEPGVELPIDLRSPGGVIIPAWTRSLVFANIPSYAGGRSLGAAIKLDDGRCDAFALPAGLALGLGLSGLRNPRKLGSHHGLALRLRRPIFLQLDGEPSLAAPGDYRIELAGSANLLFSSNQACG